MAEENTQATSEQQSSSTTGSTSTTQQTQTQETTLEDVYKTHNVDQMAQEFKAWVADWK